MTRGKATAWKIAKRDETQARRELILRAATIRLNELGYARTSMMGIAADLGLSTNALYYYFRSKAEILYGCFERSFGLIERCTEFAEHAEGSGNHQMQVFVLRFRELIEAEPLPGSWLLVHLTRARLTAIGKRDTAHQARLHSIVLRGIADGSIRECDVASTVGILLSGLYTLSYAQLSRELGEATLRDELQRLVAQALAP